MKLSSPSAARNREVIADVLARWLPDGGKVLEVASGTGEHAAHFAERFAALLWQPSDPDPESRASIEAWRAEQGLRNLLQPLDLDAAASDWPLARADAIVCINMVHISPLSTTLGLFAGGKRLLASGAPLILYGPYRRRGVETAPSNEAFDASLRARDPAWGLRDLDAVSGAASGFTLAETVGMPANNLVLLFRRDDEPPA